MRIPKHGEMVTVRCAQQIQIKCCGPLSRIGMPTACTGRRPRRMEGDHSLCRLRMKKAQPSWACVQAALATLRLQGLAQWPMARPSGLRGSE